MHPLPVVIQGGMGAGVSNWRLAQAVSAHGQLGVVSGTALDVILIRRLQDGDPGGHIRRGLASFPAQDVATRIVDRFYLDGGRRPSQPYAPLPLHTHPDSRDLVELCVAANFVEVFLAKEGHANPVGINYLEKIQVPHLPSMYGAMLAGVDFVLMGAGIPVKVPGVLDRLAEHQPATYPLYVVGAQEGDDTTMRFDPRELIPAPRTHLTRPTFLAIVSSHVLAATLLKKSNGVVNGFIIEGPTAGGHNAPPRGKLQLSEAGEPIYGERDLVDLEKIRALGQPFWLAGSYGAPDRLREALAAGATGIQVGTAFAFCEESGLRDDYKQALIEKALQGTATVFTDALASPTGFPFKVAQLEGTMSERDFYEARVRVCDLGYLREAYRTETAEVGFRCSAEPSSPYLAKGGAAEEMTGRKCICNALLSNIGLAQTRGRGLEPGIVTSGDDLTHIGLFLPPGATRYTAGDVIDRLLSSPPA